MRRLLAILAAITFAVFVFSSSVSYAEEAKPADPSKTEENKDEELQGPDESTPGKIYNFDGWDLKKAVEYLARKVKKPITYPPGLSGTINYVSFVPIKEKDLVPLFETILNLNGWQMVHTDLMIKIIQLREGEGVSTILRQDDERKDLQNRDRIITQIFKLNYLNASDAMATLSNFTTSRSIIAVPQSNSLLITDYETVILRLANILNTIDIPGPQIIHKIVSIQYANVDTLTTYVESYLQTLASSISSGGAVSAAPNPRVKAPVRANTNSASSNIIDTMAIPDPRTNSFILIGTQDQIDKVEKFINDIDQKSTSSGKYHVLRLENIPAKDIATTLNEAFSKSTTPKGSTEEKPSIIAFEGQNSLIILASQSQFDDIEAMIKELDKPQMQVLIRTVIVEISSTKAKEIGFEWGSGDYPSTDSYRGFGTTFGSSNKYVVPSTDTSFPAGSGITLGLVKDIDGVWVIPALFQAVQTDKDIELLAEPQILATDNEKAELTISENIPYYSTDNTSSSSSSTTTYGGDYTAEISLKITPHIRSKDYLTLEIEQNVEQFYQSEYSFDSNDSGSSRPSKSVRTAKTRVGVNNKGYIVIGGMTRTKTDEVVSKVPWLGDIPGIGHLFRKTSKSSEKLNLYIFLQPEIIASPDDLVSITNKHTQDMKLKQQARNIKFRTSRQKEEEEALEKQKKLEEEAKERQKNTSTDTDTKTETKKSRPSISNSK